MLGGPGNDRLFGGLGYDSLDGGEGNDLCEDGSGVNNFIECEFPESAIPSCTTVVINLVNIVGKEGDSKRAPLLNAQAMQLAKSTVHESGIQNLLDADSVWDLLDQVEPIVPTTADGEALVASFTDDPEGWAIYVDAAGSTVGGYPVVGGSTRRAVANSDCAPRKHIQWTATLNDDGTVSMSSNRQQQTGKPSS